MKRSVHCLAAAIAFVVVSAPAAAAGPEGEIRMCVRHIAEIERAVARQTEGTEKRRIIALLGAAKRQCIQGRIATAYAGASTGMTMAFGDREVR